MQTMPRIGFGRGHMFWEPPYGRRTWLGQAPAAYKDPSNRLLDQPLISVLKRRLLVVSQRDDFYKDGWPGKLDPDKIDPKKLDYTLPDGVNTQSEIDWWMQSVRNSVPSAAVLQSPFSPEINQAFFDISQDPTSQELDDADQIDAFFGPVGDTSYLTSVIQVWTWVTQPCIDGYFYTGVDYSRGDVDYSEFERNRNSPHYQNRHMGEKIDMKGRFWCSPWANGKVTAPTLPWGLANASYWVVSRHNIPWPAPGRAGFYGLTLNERWGDVKLWIKNAVLADYVLSKYPFPQPFNEYTDFWSAFALPGFRELIKSGAPLEEEDIRVWITFSILANYKDMVAELNQHFKDQARDERRAAQARMIAAAVVAVFAAIVLAPAVAAIVAGIANSTASALNKFSAHDLAVDMAKIQDAFKASDPGFSDQVGEAAAYVARLSAALEAAVDKEHVTRTLSSSALSTGLMIGGGLAAIGALALAIFRK